MITPAELLTERTDKLRERPGGKYARQWECLCPAHWDKSPSLGIAECDDGRVLINCLAGCSPEDIMAAVGLEMSDLFPYQENYKPFWRDQWPHKQRNASYDECVVAIAEDDLKAGKRLSDGDKKTLLKAKMRLSKGAAA